MLQNGRAGSLGVALIVDIIITDIFLQPVSLKFKAEKKIEGRTQSRERLYICQCIFLNQPNCNQKLNQILNMEYLIHFVSVRHVFDEEEGISLPHFESNEVMEKMSNGD